MTVLVLNTGVDYFLSACAAPEIENYSLIANPSNFQFDRYPKETRNSQTDFHHLHPLRVPPPLAQADPLTESSHHHPPPLSLSDFRTLSLRLGLRQLEATEL